jgi:8-oxo-dGTP pyrophosphatase MutT (NUDIX family)
MIVGKRGVNMSDRPLPKNAHLIPDSAKKVFTGTIFDVYQWQQELYDGSFATFEMLRRPDTASIIAIDNNQIVVLDEEQPDGVVRYNSLPAGRIELTDNSTLEGAKRELEEETGLQFNRWALLDVQQPAVKLEWFTYLYVATDKIGQIPTKHDPGEKITVKRISFDEFKQSKSAQKTEVLREINSIDELLEKVGLSREGDQ